MLDALSKVPPDPTDWDRAVSVYVGVVPAAIGLALAVRRRVGSGRVVVRLLLLLALVGIAWVATTFNLVGSSVSY